MANRDLSPELADADRGEHDALRHYVALARRGAWWVLGNGDQVVPIADDLAGGADLATAWGRHTFEPDPPIYTPRIWLAGQGSAERTSPAGSVNCWNWWLWPTAAGTGAPCCHGG